MSWLGHGFQQESTPAPEPPPQSAQATFDEFAQKFQMMKMMNDVVQQHEHKASQGNGVQGEGA